MKFSDFKVGMVIQHPPVPVEYDEVLAFAEKYDPQWFHIDLERAETGRWKGLIASGWLTCSLAMRMAVNAALHDSESFGSPGLEKLLWLLPVRPGDTLRFAATVNSVRVSSSRPDLGIVGWTWRLYNQNDEQVVEIVATNLFQLADTQ